MLKRFECKNNELSEWSYQIVFNVFQVNSLIIRPARVDYSLHFFAKTKVPSCLLSFPLILINLLHPVKPFLCIYLIGAVWLRCAHQDLGGLRYRHHSSQSKPWADSGYSSISKVSYLMLSKEGDTTRVRSSFIRCRIGSALRDDRTQTEWIINELVTHSWRSQCKKYKNLNWHDF